MYNTTVKSVSRMPSREGADEGDRHGAAGMKPAPFHVAVEQQETITMWECENVIVANGVQTPNQPMMEGHEHMLEYTDLPTNGSWADGKRVLVLGLGNAGLEAANSIQGWAAETTVMGRPQSLPSDKEASADNEASDDNGGSDNEASDDNEATDEASEAEGGLRLSYHTHYVGDMRQVNLNIMDMYQLKSLDGFNFVEDDGENLLRGHKVGFFPTTDGRLFVFQNFPCVDTASGRDGHPTGGGDGGDGGPECAPGMVQFAEVVEDAEDREALEQFAQAVAQITGKARTPGAMHEAGTDVFIQQSHTDNDEVDPTDDRLTKKARKISQYAAGGVRVVYTVSVQVDTMRRHPQVRDLVAELVQHKGSNNPHRFGYHAVVRCWGWLPDKQFYSDGVMPAWGTSGKMIKYPETSSVFESSNVPNMWFAGALTHGRDFRKAAGGFIHGFRYNARASFRAMEWKHHGVHWPHTTILLTQPRRAPMADTVDDGDQDVTRWLEDDADVARVVSWLEHRINNGDGTYQMFEQLNDACVFFAAEHTDSTQDGQRLATTPAHVKCMEEIPAAYLVEMFGDRPRVSLQFVYGENHHGPKVFEPGAIGATDGRFAERSTFLHPKLMFWTGKGGREEILSAWNHHLVEDVPTVFSTSSHRPFLTRYIRFIMSRVHWPTEAACRVHQGTGGGTVRTCVGVEGAGGDEDE